MDRSAGIITRYVCIEAALRGVPMERGFQLGLEEWSIKWVQCPNPTGTIGPTSRTLAHTCTLCALSVANFTLPAKGGLILHIGP